MARSRAADPRNRDVLRGFDLLTISFALPAFAQAWGMTPGQIGLVISSAFFGQLIGALGAGWAAERFGRLPV